MVSSKSKTVLYANTIEYGIFGKPPEFLFHVNAILEFDWSPLVITEFSLFKRHFRFNLISSNTGKIDYDELVKKIEQVERDLNLEVVELYREHYLCLSKRIEDTIQDTLSLLDNISSDKARESFQREIRTVNSSLSGVRVILNIFLVCMVLARRFLGAETATSVPPLTLSTSFRCSIKSENIVIQLDV